MTEAQIKPLTRKDYASDQEVRWCPGCGDYAILAAMQKLLASLGSRPEETVFVSGIGCSSRFPYYMNTYGFHTIHGRAPAVATGLKLSRPELDVWVVTGDGDGLSIGGNHLLHVLRRNVDLQILLFNNQIYGLTKGQYSPTSAQGKVTPSSPLGAPEHPLTPVRFALGANARFIARDVDTAKTLPDVLKAAHDFRGAAFVEIMQNCPVFNDGVFDEVRNGQETDEHLLHLEHGKPMIFGKKQDKGVVLNRNTLELEIVQLGENGVSAADLLVHDEKNVSIAWLLSGLSAVVPVGVLYRNPTETYNDAVARQSEAAVARAKITDVDQLLRSGHTWTVT